MIIIKAAELGKDFFEFAELESIDSVRKILFDIKEKGDVAVKKYVKAFDGEDLDNFLVRKEEIKEAYKKVDSETIVALKKAIANVKFFAERQMECFKDFEVENCGARLGQKVIPLDRVGCYVPGGNYPLPSSAIMSVVPAKVAKVKEVIVCSPKIKDVTIVAADLAGADKIFRIGGVQAIGAMAYGTKTIPQVDKIVGPGNKYVTAAKKEVYGTVGIDFIAGPSEVLVIADSSANAAFIAADMLAQAEHDTNARADLVTTSAILAKEVNEELERQLKELKTKDIAEQALKNGIIVLAETLEEAIDIANKRAPEHLELQVEDSDTLIPKLTNYGSLFIGENTAEVLGDYCSGTNHTLPTNGAARYTSGLSVKDFVKTVTYQKINDPKELVEIASRLAEIEGLDAHMKAADARGKNTS